MKKLIPVFLFLFLASFFVVGYIWRIETPEYGIDKIIDYENFTETFVSENITVKDRINQDNYYMAPCETNSFIDGSAVCLWANATTSLDIPYTNFQPGGAEQASYIAGSFMLVNRNQTNLLNVNRTSCAIEANRSGVELKVDCNSTSPANPLGSGPDFVLFGDSQITGEFYLRNLDGQWRFFTRELTLRDELYENILFNDANLTIEGTTFKIIDRLNETLVVNIDRSETIFDLINDSITLTLGTNTSPAVNLIHYQNKNNPTLTIDSSEPSVEHAEVAILYIGDTTNTTYLFDNTISHNEQFIDHVYDTFADSGAIYLERLNPSVSTNQINISDGTVRIRISKHAYTNNVSSDDFFYINSTGNFIQCDDFTCLDHYSTGEEISNNRYYNIIWLVVPVKDSPKEQWLLAIPQNKPTIEHVTPIKAEEDTTKVVFFSGITDFKIAETPVIRTIHRRTGNNDAVEFPTSDTGELFQDLRGQIRAGGGSVAPPPITDHDDLNNLVWNVAGHTNVSAEDINQDLPTDCPAGTAVSAWGDNLSTTTCTSFLQIHSLDDAYDDGSVIQVDDTNVVWNLTGRKDFVIESGDSNSISIVVDGKGTAGNAFIYAGNDWNTFGGIFLLHNTSAGHIDADNGDNIHIGLTGGDTIIENNLFVSSNITGSISAEDVDRDLPTDCPSANAMYGFGNNMSTTLCREFEEPGDYLINGTDANFGEFSAGFIDGEMIGLGTNTPNAIYKSHIRRSSTDSSSRTLLVEHETTQTNSISSAMTFKLTTTGNMGNGFGPGFLYAIQDTAGVENFIGRTAFSSQGADNTGRFQLHLWEAGAIKRKLLMDAGTFFIGASGDPVDIVSYSGTKLGIGTTTPSFPLEVRGNVSGISIWAEGNVSAAGYLTRTSVFDKNKNPFDYVKDSDDYLDNGKINHSKFYGYASVTIIDFSRPVIETINCMDIDDNGKEFQTNCNKTTYPYTKTEEGVSLNKEIDVLRQAIYELKTELCIYNNYSWC